MILSALSSESLLRDLGEPIGDYAVVHNTDDENCARMAIAMMLYDLTSYVRFLYTAEKIRDEWKIRSINCIYEKDALISAAPPRLSGWERKGELRSSYGNLAMVLGMEGHTVAESLPGDDRPELIEALIGCVAGWLHTAQTQAEFKEQ